CTRKTGSSVERLISISARTCQARPAASLRSAIAATLSAYMLSALLAMRCVEVYELYARAPSNKMLIRAMISSLAPTCRLWNHRNMLSLLLDLAGRPAWVQGDKERPLPVASRLGRERPRSEKVRHTSSQHVWPRTRAPTPRRYLYR